MQIGEIVREETPEADQSRFQAPSVKVIHLLMGLLVVYVIIRSIVAAATNPFWFDELLTLTISSLPNLKAVWGALSRGLDSPPPAFYVVEREFIGLLQNKHIALRLASILAFPCTLLCVFVYVKKRSGETIGLICALFLLLSSLFYRHAFEARPYSMMIACVAIALVCYQRVPSPFWTVMLSLSLMLAESFHYYAVFSMIPFGVAELVYFLSTRRFRWPVWAAMALGPAPLLFFWPLLSHLRAFYSPHYWAHYSLSSIPLTYGSFFLTRGAFGFALVAVCATGVVGARLLPTKEASNESIGRDPAEASLLLSLLLLPFPTALATHLLHGAMVDRYVVASVLGVALSLACVMSLARGRVVLIFAVFILSTIALHEFTFWQSAHSLRLDNPASPVEALVQKAGHTDLPVVISDGNTYLQMAYYASPESKKRFFFLQDGQKAVQYSGTDSVDIAFRLLPSYAPLQVKRLSEFVAAHRTFLSEVEDQGGFNWLPGYLQAEASSIQLAGADGTRKIYLITMKENFTP
jgi:mannosyltransferase